MVGPSEEEIARLVPLLRKTNPNLAHRDLEELARKMLQMSSKLEDLPEDKTVAELLNEQENESQPEHHTHSIEVQAAAKSKNPDSEGPDPENSKNKDL